MGLSSQNDDEQAQNDSMVAEEWKVSVVELKHVDDHDEEGES